MTVRRALLDEWLMADGEAACVGPSLQLSPEQQRVVSHRGSDLQVIACAGSGKTESISRRVAELIAEGSAPESVVAFTFTERLAQPPVELCVVGDDDQAIYQWRGSDVASIVSFRDRRPGAVAVTLETNRRSGAGLVQAADAFAPSIPGRLPKAMWPLCAGAPEQVVAWSAATEEDEVRRVALTRFSQVLTDFEHVNRRGRYAAAARGEGLAVEAAYLHELKDGTRRPVDVSEPAAREAVAEVTRSLDAVRRGKYRPRPEAARCKGCDFRPVCPHAAEAPRLA